MVLPVRGGGPTLVVGAGARIESIDPDSGQVLGSIAPIAVANFKWTRFLRRGSFLLAEGENGWVMAPVYHTIRGLALLDDTGRVRWIETHALTNRASRAVYLDDQGNVAFDCIDKPALIKSDGTKVELGAPPAGPLLHGPPDVLPLRTLTSEKVSSWFGLPEDQAPPAAILRQFALVPELDEREIALVQVIEATPEDPIHASDVKTVGRMSLPPVCRRARQLWEPTMSPRHWILDCAPWGKDGDALPSRLLVLDVRARQLRRIAPPPSDQSGIPRAHRLPDHIRATVAVDGTVVASIWNSCITRVYVSKAGGGWKASAVAPSFGPEFAPEPVCGHLTLQSTGGTPGITGCGGTDPPGPAAYVRRPDGSWMPLPYALPEWGSCSPDSQVVAFVAGDALTTARIDREERKVVRAGVDKTAPIAWLPPPAVKPRPRPNCETNPPPMDLAEWQRLVRVLRAHVDKTVHGRYSLRPAYVTLVQRAEVCDVTFRQQEPGQVRGVDLFVTALLGGLWAGAHFKKRPEGWVLTGLDDGSVD